MVCVVFMFHAYERPWSWELGSAMCKILPSLQVTSSLVITASLTILAVYRCVLLVKPMIPKPTPRQTCCVILICWAGSIAWSVFSCGTFSCLAIMGRPVRVWLLRGSVSRRIHPLFESLFDGSIRYKLCIAICHNGYIVLVGQKENRRTH